MDSKQIGRVVSWNTTKTAAGYAFTAYSFSGQADRAVHAAGTLPTRAQAVGKAKAWVRYLKSQQVAA